MKVPVIVRDEYTVYFECYEGHTFGHCDVRKWSPKVAKRLQKQWNVLTYLHGEPIYALHVIGDEKHKKWCQMFGFHYVSTFIGANEVPMALYKHERS